MVGRRGVLRVGDHDRRRAALHRGVPDQPADPGAVQGRPGRSRRRSRPSTGYEDWDLPPGPGDGQQNSLRNEQHQMWKPPNQPGYPDPIVYKIDVRVATHSFTTSQVLPITKGGTPAISFDATGKTYPAGTRRTLPPSTIYGFNGHVPGPDDQRRVRQAGAGPVRATTSTRTRDNLDRQDFGSPGLVVPDPPAQRAHRTGERRQPALLDAVTAPRTRATRRGCGSTTCT